MISRSFFTCVLLVCAAAAAPSASAANYGSMGQEYDQVRRIAMRDPRVREAFARAYERLDAKMIELDPALTGYIHAHPSSRSESAPISTPRSSAERTAAEPPPRPRVKTPASAPAPSGRTHVVASGETLTVIATKYGVTVGALEKANQIQDARKLRAGQTLIVP